MTLVNDFGGTVGNTEAIDLSQLGEGWNVLALDHSIQLASVTFKLTPLSGVESMPAEIAEIELWGHGKGRMTPREVTASLTGDISRLPGYLSISPAESTSFSLGVQSDCKVFTAKVTRDPATFRRGFLVFEAKGAFRSFALLRSLNITAETGGAWLTGQGGAFQWFVDPIDPSTLVQGDNHVQLCLPDDASGIVTVQNLRIVGETEHGGNLVASITTEERDVSALMDAGELLTIPAEESLWIEMERLMRPDVVLISTPTEHNDWQVTCQSGPLGNRDIRLLPRISHRGSRTALLFEGSNEPSHEGCRTLTVTRPGKIELSQIEVVGSGTQGSVDWPRIVLASTREHFGDVAWISGWASAPSHLQGPIYTSIDGEEQPLVGAFGATVNRDQDLDDPWTVTLSATFPGGQVVSREIVLDQNSRQDLEDALSSSSATSASDIERYGDEGQQVTETVLPDEGGSIRLGTAVGVDVPPGAVTEPTAITVKHLGEDPLPMVDPEIRTRV